MQGFNSFGQAPQRWAEKPSQGDDGAEQLQKRTEFLLQKIMNTPLGSDSFGQSPSPSGRGASTPTPTHHRSGSVTPQPGNGQKPMSSSYASYADSPPAYGAHAFQSSRDDSYRDTRDSYRDNRDSYRDEGHQQRSVPYRDDRRDAPEDKYSRGREAEPARQQQRFGDRERRDTYNESPYQRKEQPSFRPQYAERGRGEAASQQSGGDWWRSEERREEPRERWNDHRDQRDQRDQHQAAPSRYDSSRRDDRGEGPFNRSRSDPAPAQRSDDSDRKRNRDVYSSDDRDARGGGGRFQGRDEGRFGSGRGGEGSGDAAPSYAASMAASGPSMVRDSATTEAYRIPARKFWLLGLPHHTTLNALREEMSKYTNAPEVNLLKVAGEPNGVGIAVFASVKDSNNFLTRAAEYGQQGRMEKYNLCVRLLGVDVMVFLHSSAGPERRSAWAKSPRADLEREGWLIDKECGTASTFQGDCGIVITSGIPTFATPVHIRYLVKSILESEYIGRTNIGPVMSMDSVTDICVQAPDNAKLQTKPTVQVLFSDQVPRLKVLLALQNKHAFLSNKPEESRVADTFNDKRGDPIAIRCLVAEVIPLAKHGMVLRQLLGGAVDEVIAAFDKKQHDHSIDLTRLTHAWKTAYVNQIFNNYRRVDLRGYNNLYLVATRIHNAMYPTSTKIQVDGQQVDLVPPAQGREFFATLGQAISRLWAQDRQKFTDYCAHVLGPEWQRLMFASDMMHVDGFIRTGPLDNPHHHEAVVEGESLDPTGMASAGETANCVEIDARLEDDSSEYEYSAY